MNLFYTYQYELRLIHVMHNFLLYYHGFAVKKIINSLIMALFSVYQINMRNPANYESV